MAKNIATVKQRKIYLNATYAKKIAQGGGLISFILLSIMMLMGVANVVADLIGHPLPAIAEMTECLMVGVVFFAIIWVTYENAHISMSLLDKYWKGWPAWAVDLFGLMLKLFIFAIMAWRLSINAIYSIKQWEYVDVIIKIYWWPSKLAAAIGCFLTAIVVFFQILEHFNLVKSEKRIGGEEAE